MEAVITKCPPTVPFQTSGWPPNPFRRDPSTTKPTSGHCREIFSLGDDPFPGYDVQQLTDRLEKGYRLSKPKYCPDDV